LSGQLRRNSSKCLAPKQCGSRKAASPSLRRSDQSLHDSKRTNFSLGRNKQCVITAPSWLGQVTQNISNTAQLEGSLPAGLNPWAHQLDNSMGRAHKRHHRAAQPFYFLVSKAERYWFRRNVNSIDRHARVRYYCSEDTVTGARKLRSSQF